LGKQERSRDKRLKGTKTFVPENIKERDAAKRTPECEKKLVVVA
jgi:hypothetical protein